MSNDKNNPNSKANLLAEELRQHFIKLGEDIKKHALSAFQAILEEESKAINPAQSVKVLPDNNQTQNNVTSSGSVLGGILNNLVIPTLFEGISKGRVDITSPRFREAAGQALLDIGKVITKNQVRNG